MIKKIQLGGILMKKVVLFLLTASLIAGVFVGCNHVEENTTTVPGANPTSSQEPEDPTPTVDESEIQSGTENGSAKSNSQQNPADKKNDSSKPASNSKTNDSSKTPANSKPNTNSKTDTSSKTNTSSKTDTGSVPGGNINSETGWGGLDFG